MKKEVKIFSNAYPEVLEKNINIWLSNNQDVQIVDKVAFSCPIKMKDGKPSINRTIILFLNKKKVVDKSRLFSRQFLLAKDKLTEQKKKKIAIY